MSAGGPFNPQTVLSAEVYLPPSQDGPTAHQVAVGAHPYRYFPAVCDTCGTTLNFASENVAEEWAKRHAEASLDTLKESR